MQISIPKMASPDMAMGVLGTTGGVLAGAFIGSATVSAARLTGNAALAGGLVVKGGMGLLSIIGAGKITGTGSTALGLFGMGCMASMAIDLIDRVFPRATAALKLGAPILAAPIRTPIRIAPVAALPLPVVPVTAPIGIAIKR